MSDSLGGNQTNDPPQLVNKLNGSWDVLRPDVVARTVHYQGSALCRSHGRGVWRPTGLKVSQPPHRDRRDSPIESAARTPRKGSLLPAGVLVFDRSLTRGGFLSRHRWEIGQN